MNKEIWKDIKGYEGLYQISNYGKVKSLDRIKKSSLKNQDFVRVKSRILKQYTNKKGYLLVQLNKNGMGKTKQLHRLVAEAFIPNPDKLSEVNHKDENPGNNCADNLEWCDSKYNNNYGTRIDRMTISIEQYTKDNIFIKLWKNEAEIIKVLKIYHTGDCCKGKRKTAGGYIWKYFGDSGNSFAGIYGKEIDGIQMK